MSKSAPKKLNGSVDLLAKAMKAVFEESMESVKDGMNEDLKLLEEVLKEEIRSANDTTNQNMQAQFAEQEEKISSLISGQQKESTNKRGSRRAAK